MYINYEDLKKYITETIHAMDNDIAHNMEALHAACTLSLLLTRLDEEIERGDNIRTLEEQCL